MVYLLQAGMLKIVRAGITTLTTAPNITTFQAYYLSLSTNG